MSEVLDCERSDDGDAFVDARNACIAELKTILDQTIRFRLKEKGNAETAFRIINKCRTRLREIGGEVYCHQRKIDKRLARRSSIAALTQPAAP